MQESSKQLEEADSVDQKLSIYESLLNELIDAQQSLKEEYKDDVVGLLYDNSPWDHIQPVPDNLFKIQIPKHLR